MSTIPSLRVYAFYPAYAYSGGVMLVAAHSGKAAKVVVADSNSAGSVGEPQLVRGLSWRGRHARIVVDAIYTE